MNNTLSRIIKTSKHNPAKGFTLVELMVVIAIIAVLATVGLTLFQNSQRSARNSKRQGDLQAIANALETHYQPTVQAGATCPDGTSVTGASYCGLMANFFTGGSVPVDPIAGANYCVSYSTTASPANATNMAPTGTAGACNTSANGGTGYTNWATVGANVPPDNITGWKICATLEPFGTGGVYCVSNQQS